MRKPIGRVFETFTIGALRGRAVILDKDWPCPANRGDTVEIQSASGETFSSVIRDKIPFDPKLADQTSRVLPSLLLDEAAFEVPADLLNAEVYLITEEAKGGR